MRSKTHPPYRKLRRTYDIPGHAHELTFSCLRRLPLLEDERCKNWLVLALDNARRRLGIEIWAYVIMPEHVHVLVSPNGAQVREILTSIKQPVARKALARASASELQRLRVRRGRRLAFWQPGGGYDRNAYGDSAIRAMINYIHKNPVKRGLVETPVDWFWSSARWYAGLGDVALEVDPPPRLVGVKW